MDEDSATAVRCVVGVAEDFDVKVGLHQGFEPMFFAIVMDMMPDDIRQEDPSNYNRANDVAVCPCVRVCVWQPTPKTAGVTVTKIAGYVSVRILMNR